MSPRVSTYLPFTVTAYLNGNHFVSECLRSIDVTLVQRDNAILHVSDLVALQAAADGLTPAVLRERVDHWAAKVAPSFSPAERAAMDLRYRYSLVQVELATDVILAAPSPLRALPPDPRGLKLGVLLDKLRTRLLGPLATLAAAPAPPPDTTSYSTVEAAFRRVGRAIDQLCTTLGLAIAA